MRRRISRTVVAAFVLGMVGSRPTQAAEPAAQQVIPLAAGWNLISIQIGNAPLPIASFRSSLNFPERLTDVWGYEPSGDPARPGTWRAFVVRPGIADFPHDLTVIEPGRGYWVKVDQAAIVTLSGPPSTGVVPLLRGWNLVGFAVSGLRPGEPHYLASVFGSKFDRISQVWTFDSSAQRFLGYDQTAIPVTRSLSGVSPGLGFWVYALETIQASDLTPDPYLALPPDADQSPLQTPETFVLSANPSLPDRDYYHGWAQKGEKVRYRGAEDVAFDLNNNGLLDSPFTQDTIVFEPGVDTQVISLGNRGPGADASAWTNPVGVFPWQIVKNGSIPWLKFDDGTGPVGTRFADLPDSVSGVVSSERDSVVLRVDRSGIEPGRKDSTITVYAGMLERTLKLVLRVPNSGGDWKGFASVRQVNGKGIALGKVDLALSFIMNSESLAETGFRAVLNRDRSLLFPKDVFMNGVFYAGNQFSLTTSFVMPAGDRNAPPYDTFQHSADEKGDRDSNRDGRLDVANPFGRQITREVSLLGKRESPDRLAGSYVEAIGGLLPAGQLIYMEGEFELVRESVQPTKRSAFNGIDSATFALGGGGSLGALERTITVTEPVTIQGVTASLQLAFSRPAALKITLQSPQGTKISLHEYATSLPSPAAYDRTEFNGQSGLGTWILRVEWDPVSTPERGSFTGWSLNLQGVATYTVAGRVLGPDSLPLAGAEVILTGGNLLRQAVSVAGTGSFSFEGLTENTYTLSVSRAGFVTRYQPFTLSEGKVTLIPVGQTLPVLVPSVDVALAALPGGQPALVAAPAAGFAPQHTTLQIHPASSVLAQVGANPTATWNFGDGTPAVADTASLVDGVTLTVARHTYTQAGYFSAAVTVSGGSGTVNLQVPVLVQRTMPSIAGAAYQLVGGAFIGSLAAATGAGGAPSPPIQVAELVLRNISLIPAGGTAITLSGVKSAVVWQESKRDTAAFDVDRWPAGFQPTAEDTDFRREETQRLEYPAPPGTGAPVRRTLPAPIDYPDANGVFDTYTPATVAGEPFPERLKMIVTMGGYVFGSAPSAAGEFRLQAGVVEP